MTPAVPVLRREVGKAGGHRGLRTSRVPPPAAPEGSRGRRAEKGAAEINPKKHTQIAQISNYLFLTFLFKYMSMSALTLEMVQTQVSCSQNRNQRGGHPQHKTLNAAGSGAGCTTPSTNPPRDSPSPPPLQNNKYSPNPRKLGDGCHST